MTFVAMTMSWAMPRGTAGGFDAYVMQVLPRVRAGVYLVCGVWHPDKSKSS